MYDSGAAPLAENGGEREKQNKATQSKAKQSKAKQSKAKQSNLALKSAVEGGHNDRLAVIGHVFAEWNKVRELQQVVESPSF